MRGPAWWVGPPPPATPPFCLPAAGLRDAGHGSRCPGGSRRRRRRGGSSSSGSKGRDGPAHQQVTVEAAGLGKPPVAVVAVAARGGGGAERQRQETESGRLQGQRAKGAMRGVFERPKQGPAGGPFKLAQAALGMERRCPGRRAGRRQPAMPRMQGDCPSPAARIIWVGRRRPPAPSMPGARIRRWLGAGEAEGSKHKPPKIRSSSTLTCSLWPAMVP